MSEQRDQTTGGSSGGQSAPATPSPKQPNDDRIDDRTRRILQSMRTSPSEVTIGMIRQTNGPSGAPR
jgi:hypothetical protein